MTEKNLLRGTLTLACLLAFTAAPGVASELSETAESMSAGSFVELKTKGLTHSFMTNGCSSPITSFSDSAAWDPVGRTFLFIGGPHGCPHTFSVYTESTNAWSNWPTFAKRATHGYDHMAIDVASRLVYFRRHGAGGFHAYDIDAGSWQLDVLPKPSTTYNGVSGGLEFFPELNTLVHINYSGFGRVHVASHGQWKHVQTVSMGTRDAFIEYNPKHGLILFGGGRGRKNKLRNREIYALHKNGKIEKKNDAPLGFGTHVTIVTVDPESGKYLVFANGKLFYEYDVIKDSWRQLAIPVPFFQKTYSTRKEVVATVAAPVTTHGVVMFLQHLKVKKGGAKVWLYKHFESEGVSNTAGGPTAG